MARIPRNVLSDPGSTVVSNGRLPVPSLLVFPPPRQGFRGEEGAQRRGEIASCCPSRRPIGRPCPFRPVRPACDLQNDRVVEDAVTERPRECGVTHVLARMIEVDVRDQCKPKPVSNQRSRAIAAARVGYCSECANRHGPACREVYFFWLCSGVLCSATRRAKLSVWPIYRRPVASLIRT